MPIYEYVCDDCGKTTEVLRAMSQADETLACQHCKGKKTRRAQSVFAAAVSGGGSQSASLPMGGCCPCGKNQGSCASN